MEKDHDIVLDHGNLGDAELQDDRTAKEDSSPVVVDQHISNFSIQSASTPKYKKIQSKTSAQIFSNIFHANKSYNKSKPSQPTKRNVLFCLTIHNLCLENADPV